MGIYCDASDMAVVTDDRNRARSGERVKHNLLCPDLPVIQNLPNPLRSESGRVAKPPMHGQHHVIHEGARPGGFQVGHNGKIDKRLIEKRKLQLHILFDLLEHELESDHDDTTTPALAPIRPAH